MYDRLQVLFQSTENNKTIGQQGEEISHNYLVEKGYSILERNWRIGHLEIDLIAEKQGLIIVVEVKFRREEEPLEAGILVNKKKQAHLIKATQAYLEKTNCDKEVRFDVMVITVKNGQPQVNHIEDAFYSHM